MNGIFKSISNLSESKKSLDKFLKQEFKEIIQKERSKNCNKFEKI